MKKFAHVCMTPALIDQFDVEGSIVVVIDILRATTSMCVAFGNEVKLMAPVEKVEEALAYREQGFLVAGERGGIIIDGFDLGNSPFDYMKPQVKGAKIAITTTNGTRALKAAQLRGAKEVVIGAFPNMSLLVDWIKEQNEDVCLLCSGWQDNFTLEDGIFAGAIAQRIRHHFSPYQDTFLLARSLYRNASSRKRYFFRHSSHYRRLIHLNLQEDVKYAMRHDTQKVLPLLVDDFLHDFSDVKNIEAYKNKLRKDNL